MAITWARTSSYIDRQNAAQIVGYGTVTLDDTYIKGGWALTKATVNPNITTVRSYQIEPVPGFDIKWDHANGKLQAVKNAPGYNSTQSLTCLVTDDDDAATTGTALLVSDADFSGIGFLESENANNLEALAAMSDGGPTVAIRDNAGSATGVQVYCDHDAAYGKQLQCVSPGDVDIHVPLSDGTFLTIVHDADAATNGVAVYFDDDATNNYERIMCVTAGDADVLVDRPTMPIDALDGVVIRLKYEAV